MPHPGDALTQSHYSPKGGIYADAYYMGKKGLYHLNLLQLTDLVACSAVLHLEQDSPCYLLSTDLFCCGFELSFFCLTGSLHYCSLVHEKTKFIQEIIRASLVYVPEVSLSGLDSKPFHKQQFFQIPSNIIKQLKFSLLSTKYITSLWMDEAEDLEMRRKDQTLIPLQHLVGLKWSSHT